jgi:hypothetical protein
MRITLGKVIIAVLVLGAAYVAIFQREWALSLFRKGVQKAKGYELAKTPNEALEQFCKATRERDYDTAQELYCTGDYAEQLRKAAKPAKDLGEHVDKLLEKMESTSMKSDKAKVLLRLLDPFPTTMEIQEVKQKGDDKATGVLKNSKEVGDINAVTWTFKPPLVFRALYAAGPRDAPLSTIKVDLKRQEKDGKQFWKIVIPVKAYMRSQVNLLVDKGPELCKALRKLTQELNNEATTKVDFEKQFQEKLQDAMK